MRISSRTVGRALRTSSVCQRAVISAIRLRSSASSCDSGMIEMFEQIGDAAAFEHHAATGDFGWMRREDGEDTDPVKKLVSCLRADAGLAHASKGSA